MKSPMASWVTGVKTKTGHTLEPAPVEAVRDSPVIPATMAGEARVTAAVTSPED